MAHSSCWWRSESAFPSNLIEFVIRFAASTPFPTPGFRQKKFNSRLLTPTRLDRRSFGKHVEGLSHFRHLGDLPSPSAKRNVGEIWVFDSGPDTDGRLLR